MRILRLIARLNVGGPARHVIWLTSRLGAPFHQTLGTGRVEANEEEMTEFCAREGVTPIYVEGLGRSIGPQDLGAFLRVLRLIRETNPDVVDTHTAKAGMLGRLAVLLLNLFRRRKIRTIHTFHGHVLHGYFSPAVSRVFRLIEQFLGRFATDRIIVISEQQRQELSERYRVAPRDRFRLVRLGIDTEAFRVREGGPGPEIRIGLVGRLTAIKNPFLFLEAGLKAQESEPRIRLVVVGDGELREEMERRAAGRAEFLGNRNDIEAIMPALDMLIISSDNEGTPMSVIEAFAAGVVVAGTKAGGVVDLLAEGRGLLSECGDASGLAENILRFCRDEVLLRSTRAKALEYVRREYALERLIREMRSLYQEVLER